MIFNEPANEAKAIASRVVKDNEVDSVQLYKWIEGASERLLQQEQEIKSLKFNLYMFIFVLIGLPILARFFGG